MGRVRTFAVAVLAAALLTGCFTGDRPHLAPEVAAVNDPAVRDVIDRLEATNDAQFTAVYTILTKLGSEPIPPTQATVAQASPTALAVTIGSIRFLDQDGNQQTCNLATAACPAGLDDAQVSGLLVSHGFYAASPAARLRQDAATMVGAALPSTREIAGQTATCVQVNFAAGTKVYCVLDSGVLAFQDTPDLQIDLLSFTNGTDPAQFTISTVAES